MTIAKCPSCQGEIDTGRQPDIGQRVKCPDCGLVSEIIWLYPLELDLFAHEQSRREEGDLDKPALQNEEAIEPKD